MNIRTFGGVLIIVMLCISVVQSYWNHQDTNRRKERIEAMLNDPHARPDAWTKKMDDDRMVACRQSIYDWVEDNFVRKDK